jgi:signal peptide peptidase
MKILWPKSKTFSMENGSMMLGLGDIVVPGTFISLALRYDHYRYRRAAHPDGTFAKPYFIASLVAYVAGLAITMAIMHVFHSAQPALLYLRYFHPFHYNICVLNGLSHETEIALLVYSPLFSPPGAAGSLSKPGDGMMELAPRPRMGTQWTNQLAIPRTKHRPPIPRMP